MTAANFHAASQNKSSCWNSVGTDCMPALCGGFATKLMLGGETWET
ncbi:MAG: hypothetical protein KME26_23005 [Oscillatoria princeps RMCB-10]|nr:hypothetical protein [Oscillatoria princeps RMCB-10]